jgi:hypothetical protein
MTVDSDSQALTIAVSSPLKLIKPTITERPPYIDTIIAENPYPSMDTPLNFS